MAIDTKSFEMQLKAGLVEIREQAQEVLVDTALEIMRDTIMATPVDNGALRSNWRMAVDSTDTDYDESHVKGEGLSAATTLAAKIKSYGTQFDHITISNNLPYAKVVEYGGYPNPPKLGTRVGAKKDKDGKVTEAAYYEIRSEGGYSKQAPKGMFRISLLKFNSIARKHAKKRMGKK